MGSFPEPYNDPALAVSIDIRLLVFIKTAKTRGRVY